MLPDDIPTEVTKLVYGARFCETLGQAQAAIMLAHFWPAIEQHIRAQVALEIETTAEANRQGLLPRPKPGHGERLNDWRWAAAVARHADDTSGRA